MVTGMILAGGVWAGRAATTNAPDFKEVYDVLRAHLPGAMDDSLNQAAVHGLLTELTGRAELLGGTDASAPTNLVRAAVLEKTVLWLRINRVVDGLSSSLQAAGQAMTVSNKLAGTILDLRFTPGDAYGTVKDAMAAVLPAKTPVVVLVNGATSGAAELLAAELRDGGALLLGSTTAGLAMSTEDFPLGNGQRLRVATTPIKMDGRDVAPVEPAIKVKVDPEQERAWMDNPYGLADQTAEGGTNSLAALLDHTTEADLVRQKEKDRAAEDSPFPTPPAKAEPAAQSEPPRPVLRDPVLARAVDLVEGLAVLRQGHP